MSDYIPPELIPNILARLPVDDAVRCTSVCKSWYSLITSPSFVSSQLNLSNQEPRVLVRYFKPLSNNFNYCLHRDDQRFNEISELDPPSDSNCCHIIDSINGLVCVSGLIGGEIVLWNPSIRKSIILPNSRVLSASQRLYNCVTGFGFIATSNDYKIVKFSYPYKTEPLAEIYQLSTNSWRDLKPEHCLDMCSNQTHLNGVLHWYRSISGKGYTHLNLIYTFDLKNEKLGTLMLPSCLRHDEYFDNDAAYNFPFTYKESLCLIEYGRDKLRRIWVMKEYGVSDSWQKLFTINPDEYFVRDRLYFRHNGEIMFMKSLDPRSLRLKLVSYNHKNNRVTNDGLLTISHSSSIHTYVESLALINIPNEVKIDEESTSTSSNIRGFSGLLLNQTNETENWLIKFVNGRIE